jgi:hypothetical protein
MVNFETKTIEVEILPYEQKTGVVSWHDQDERILVTAGKDAVVIKANKQGLRALARELLTLAQDEVPSGCEVYLMSKGHAPTLCEESSALQMIRVDVKLP